MFLYSSVCLFESISQDFCNSAAPRARGCSQGGSAGTACALWAQSISPKTLSSIPLTNLNEEKGPGKLCQETPSWGLIQP